MPKVGRIALCALTGGLAGLFALVTDELMARITLGQWISIPPRLAFVYLVAGAAAGLLVEGSVRLVRRRAWNLRRVFCAAVALVYAATIFDRLYNAAATRMPLPLVLIGATAAVVVGFGLWVLTLRRILTVGNGRTDAISAALLLASCSVALGYAINHNQALSLLEPAALAADAALIAGTVAAAFGMRFFGPRFGTWRSALTITAAAVLTMTGLAMAGLTRPAATRSPEHGETATGPRPHLILVVIDTLRYDTFEAVVGGTAEGRAFHEALGAAAWFDKAVAAAPWTAPSVGSIMTGLYPLEHGFGSSWNSAVSSSYRRLSDTAIPLAVRLHDNGYRTEAIVTNSVLHPVWGLERGFEHYEMLSHPAEILPLPNLLVRAGVLQRVIYQPAEAVTRRLRQRLSSFDAGARPLFVWLHLTDPHYPVHAHPDLTDEAPTGDLTEWERLYRQETRYTLRELTRMIELLKDSGIWDDAAFVLVSDHGEMFESDGHVVEVPGREPVRVGHGHSLYEAVMHVPLVMRPPGGLPAARRVETLASHTDLHDTLLDLLGIDGPRSGGDRVSLAPWLARELPPEDPPRRDHALIMVNMPNLGPPQRGLRSESVKYVQFPNGELPDELYDLVSDAGERDNRASREPFRREEARRLLEESWSRLEATDGEEDLLTIDDDTRQRLKALGYVD